MLIPRKFLVNVGFSSFFSEIIALSRFAFSVVAMESLLSVVVTLELSFPFIAVVSDTLVMETDSESY